MIHYLDNNHCYQYHHMRVQMYPRYVHYNQVHIYPVNTYRCVLYPRLSHEYLCPVPVPAHPL